MSSPSWTQPQDASVDKAGQVAVKDVVADEVTRIAVGDAALFPLFTRQRNVVVTDSRADKEYPIIEPSRAGAG